MQRQDATRLQGLKENVIVGRLIPAGTGGAMTQIRLRQVATADATTSSSKNSRKHGGNREHKPRWPMLSQEMTERCRIGGLPLSQIKPAGGRDTARGGFILAYSKFDIR